jgi:hypothetical protein
MPYRTDAINAGASPLRKIANALTEQGIQPPLGGDRWHAGQVRRLIGGAAKRI